MARTASGVFPSPVFLQPSAVLKVLIPGDEGREFVVTDDFSLFHRGAAVVRRLAGPKPPVIDRKAPVRIRAGISRIAQDCIHRAEVHRPALDLPFIRSLDRADAKANLTLRKILEDGVRASQFVELVEEKPDRCANLFVGVEDQVSVRIRSETSRIPRAHAGIASRAELC